MKLKLHKTRRKKGQGKGRTLQIVVYYVTCTCVHICVICTDTYNNKNWVWKKMLHYSCISENISWINYYFTE